MTDVIVTGALGRVGRWVTQALVDGGHEVVAVDLRKPRTPWDHDNPTFKRVDLSNGAQARDLVTAADPDALVHLAGIPNPYDTVDSETFVTNVEPTYHLFTAAGRADATIVWPSSTAVYGMVFADDPWPPQYLPIDESHPTAPEDAYACSKLAAEQIAETVANRYGVSVTSLRPTWIATPGEYDRTRHIRTHSNPDDGDFAGSYWAYVDVRDLATLVVRCLETEPAGHTRMLAAAPDNFMGAETLDLLERAFGTVPEECSISGEESVYTTATARNLVDWTPRHTWQTAQDADVDPPDFGG